MTLFWAIAGAMAIGALAFVVVPLARAPARAPRSDHDENVAIYRDRLGALDAELEADTIDAQRHAALKADLDRTLLEDLSAGPEPRDANIGDHGGKRLRMFTAAALVSAISAGSFGTYLALGTPDALHRDSPAPTAAGGPADEPDPARMVAALAERLSARPDDGDGWLLLARSRMVLGQSSEALVAYQRASELLGEDVNLLTDWAEAEATAADNRFNEAARARLERALELEPEHPKALWLSGFAALQQGEPDRASQRWRSLLYELEPGSREDRLVRDVLAQVASAAAGAGAPAKLGTRIEVTVQLSPDVAGRLDGSASVFVFARPPTGPPMPLAVERTTLGALPVTVTLDATDAMVAGRSLDTVEGAVVVARASASGDPTRGPGDIESTPVPVRTGTSSRITVVLDTPVE